MRRGYVSADDLRLVHVTDDVDDAVDEILGFYAQLPLAAVRRRAGSCCACSTLPSDDASSRRSTATFADIIVRGAIEAIDATPEEIADDDHVDLARIAFRFDRRGWARLRMLIDRLNDRPTADSARA